MYDNDNKNFHTSDLSLATFLYCFFPVSSLSKEKDDKVLIAFAMTEELVNSIELYRSREARVEPQLYFQNLKMLKSWIYEELKR